MSSYTDLFRTFQEMDTEEDFIQYLERIVSGNPTDSAASEAHPKRSSGINRPLARLSHNADALYEALVSSRSTTVNFDSSAAGEGTFLFASNFLTTSHNLHVKFVNPLGGAKHNVIAAGSSAALTNGQVLYVEVDRDNDAAVLTYQVATDWDAFIAAHSSTGLALDLFMVAYRAYNSLVLWDGTRIRQGSMISHEGTKSSAYAERILEQQDVNTFLTVAATASTNLLSYSSLQVVTWPDVEIHLPGGGATVIKATSGSLTLGTDGMAIYANVPRDDQGLVSSGSVSFSAGALSTIDVDQSATGTDLFVFAVRRDTASVSVLYLCNGRAVHAGDTLDLTEQAGVRSIEVEGDGVLMTGDVKVDNDDGGISFSTVSPTSATPEIKANISIGSSHGAFGGFDRVEAVYMPVAGSNIVGSNTIDCPDLWRVRIAAGWVVLNDRLYSTTTTTDIRFPWGEGSSAFLGVASSSGAFSDPDDRATKVEAWLATQVGVGIDTVPWKTLSSPHNQAPSTGTPAGWRSPAGWPGGWNEHDTGVAVDGLWMDTWAYIYVCPSSSGGSQATFAVDNRPPQSNGVLTDLAPWEYNTSTGAWTRGTATVAKCIGTVFMDRVDALAAKKANDYWTTVKPRPFVRTGTTTRLLSPLPFDGFGNPSYDTTPAGPDSTNQYLAGEIEYAWEWHYKHEVNAGPRPPMMNGVGLGWDYLRFAPVTHPAVGKFGSYAAMEWDFFYWGPIAGMPGTNYGDATVASVVPAQVITDGWVDPTAYQAGNFDGFPDAWPALPYSGCDKGYPGATGAPATAVSLSMTWNVYPIQSLGSTAANTTLRGAMEPFISVVTSAKNANSLSSEAYSDLTGSVIATHTFGLGGSTYQETRYYVSSHEPDIQRSVEPSAVIRHRLNTGGAITSSGTPLDFVSSSNAAYVTGDPTFVHTGNFARSAEDPGSGIVEKKLAYTPYFADDAGAGSTSAMINMDHYHQLMKNGIDGMKFQGWQHFGQPVLCGTYGEWQFTEASAGNWYLDIYEGASGLVSGSSGTAATDSWRLRSISEVDTSGSSEDHITREGLAKDFAGADLIADHSGLQQAAVSIDIHVPLSGVYLPWKAYPWTPSPSNNPAIDKWLHAYDTTTRKGGTINKWMYTGNEPAYPAGGWNSPTPTHWCQPNVKPCSTWSATTARDVPIGASDIDRLQVTDWPGMGATVQRCGSVGFTYNGIQSIHSIYITSYEENFNAVAPVIYEACFPGNVLP